MGGGREDREKRRGWGGGRDTESVEDGQRRERGGREWDEGWGERKWGVGVAWRDRRETETGKPSTNQI